MSKEQYTQRLSIVIPALILSFGLFFSGCDVGNAGGGGGGGGNVVHVDSRSVGLHDGKSWGSAYLTVQEGINDSTGSGNEVWVAVGIYKESLVLKNGVNLYGGFAGSETSRNQRNWGANLTVLDGNNDNRIIQYVGVHTQAACIDGFTIRNGNVHGNGGAINCDSDSMGYLTIVNNTIINNKAYSGGGISLSFSSCTIQNNVISDNTATLSGYHDGGGIRADDSSDPVITGNRIENNDAWNGAGIYFTGSWGKITNNIIRNNINGCGVRCELNSITSVLIANNAIVGNNGKGLDISSVVSRVYNNAICGNSAEGINQYGGSSTIANNIIAFNGGGIRKSNGDTAVLRDNCVHGNINYDYSGMTPGTGDISDNPALSTDYYHLQATSPCIGAGDNSVIAQNWLDIDGQPRIHGSNVDIGCDEYQP